MTREQIIISVAITYLTHGHIGAIKKLADLGVPFEEGEKIMAEVMKIVGEETYG